MKVYKEIIKNYSYLNMYVKVFIWVIVLYNCLLFHQWPKGGICYLKHQTQQQPENHLGNLFTLVWIWQLLFMAFALRNNLTGEELEHLSAMAACTVFRYFCAAPFLCASKQKSFSIMDSEYCLNISIATQTMCGKTSNIYCQFVGICFADCFALVKAHWVP